MEFWRALPACEARMPHSPLETSPVAVLRPVSIQDYEWIRGLLREGARDGAFDPELAHDTAQSAQFFRSLARALVSGRFSRDGGQDADEGDGIHGYVFESGDASAQPLAFAILKELPGDLCELWLAAVAPDARRHGVGTAMLRAILATPAGRRMYVARINNASVHADAMALMLNSVGFACARTGGEVDWYVHENAPPSLMAFIRAAPADLAGRLR